MIARLLTARAVRVAVVIEVFWAILVAYEAHDLCVGPFHGRISQPWDVQLLDRELR